MVVGWTYKMAAVAFAFSSVAWTAASTGFGAARRAHGESGNAKEERKSDLHD